MINPATLSDFALSFLSILLEGMPFILLGTIISGLVDAFLPPSVMEKLLPRRPFAAVTLSGILGVFFPVCECGVVPVIRRLVQKGLPVACGVTYMLAAPIVNPIVFASTYLAFQKDDPLLTTLLRCGGGFFVAVCVGMIVLRLRNSTILRERILNSLPSEKYRDLSPEDAAKARAHDEHDHTHSSFSAKLAHALQAGTQDFLDVMFYFVIGASLTALFNTSVDQSYIAGLSGNLPVAVILMMVVAFLLSLCSSSDAFIAANLLDFPKAAKLAFLTFGPMFDLKLIFLYATVFRVKFIAYLGLGLFLGIGVLSMLWNVVLSAL